MTRSRGLWTLEAGTVQILFADLQPTMVARSKTNPPAALAAAAGVLAEVAVLLGLPVHFSVAPEDSNPPVLIPELARQAGGAALLPRMSASPFLDAATRSALNSAGRRTLIIAGFAMEVVVLHAARAALAADFDVLVPVDACGGMSSRTEDAAIRQIEAAGGVTTSVVGLVTALEPDASKSPGQEAFAVLQTLRLA